MALSKLKFINYYIINKILSCSFFLIFTSLFANPQKESIVSGSVNFDRYNGVLTVEQSSDKAIVNWQDFSISPGEMTKFIQPNNFSAILNRVVGDNPSSILGTLQSNGAVYLINQNGILIGPSGIIDTNGFIASTLDVSDSEFLNNNNLRFVGDSLAKVENQGTIKSTDGDIYLIAREVENNNLIQSKNAAVNLLGATDILLVQEGKDKIAVKVSGDGKVTNHDTIKAVQINLQSAGGNIAGLAINQDGLITASGLEKKDGKIVLLTDDGEVSVSGTMIAENNDQTGGVVHVLGDYIKLTDNAQIDVSGSFGGGEILIGGDYKGENPDIKNANAIYAGPDTNFNADANIKGDGGKIIFWGTDCNKCYATATAKGGIESGDGGFVETSSLGFLDPNVKIDTSALNGKTGLWLLDPRDVAISTGADSGGSFDGGSPTNTYTPTADNAIVNTTTLQTNLASANVTITTGATGVQNGDITVSNDVTWSAATTLTLTANRRILINSGVTISNTNGTQSNFEAINMTANGIPSGNYRGIEVRGTIQSNYGNIRLTGTGGDTGSSTYGVHLEGNAFAGTIRSLGSGSEAAKIFLTGTANGSGSFGYGINIERSNALVTSEDGDISFVGQGGSGTGSFQHGIVVFESSVTSTGAGADAAIITMKGTGGTGSSRSHGIQLRPTSFSTEEGDISITGISGSGGTDNYGIYINNNNITSTGSANISFTGSLNGMGMSFFEDGTPVIGGGSATGDITITADDVVLTGNLQSTGVLTIQPNTTSTTIGLGNSSSGTLNLTNTELALIQNGFSSITFGRSDGTGAVDMRAYTYNDPVEVIGGSITTNGTITMGTNSLTLTADSMNLANSLASSGTGTVTIRPRQAATTIGLGNSASGTLNLTDTELGNISSSFATQTFGRTDGTGAVDMRAYNYSNPLVVYGGSVNINGNISTGSDTLTFNVGPASAGAFTLNDAFTLTGSSVTVNGGASGNTFTINSTAAQPQTVTLNGGAGTDSITGPNTTNIWSISAANTGTLNTTDISFTGMNNLKGGNSADIFNFSDGASITGSLDGTSTSGNTLNLSAYTSAVTVDLTTTSNTTGVGSLSNVQIFTGGSTSSDTFKGPASNVTWTVTAQDTATITGAAQTYSFTSFENWDGSTGNDTYLMNESLAINVTGDIDSNGGADTLDYSNYTSTPVNINLAAGTATGVGGNIFNFHSVVVGDGGTLTGGSGDDTFIVLDGIATVDGGGGNNKLIGPDNDKTWIIDGTNSGSISGVPPITFTRIQNIKGGTAQDLFVMQPGGTLAGILDGGPGINTLDYTNYPKPVYVDFANHLASGLGGWLNIQIFIGVDFILSNQKKGAFLTDLFLLNTEIEQDAEYYSPYDFFVKPTIRFFDNDQIYLNKNRFWILDRQVEEEAE